MQASRGTDGNNVQANLELSCRLCNMVKDQATLEEFIFGLLWIWLYKNMPLLACEVYRRVSIEAWP